MLRNGLKDAFRLTLFALLLPACGLLRSCSPHFSDLKTQYPHVIYHGPKEPFEVVLKKTPPPDWTPLSSVSKAAQRAILISEDAAFYSHPGYDERQIREAIEESIQEGHLSRGASTITQQVVKNVYLSNERSIVRKVRELWMATKVEKVVGKRRILEIYLNIAEWGEGIFGIGRAARHYFKKSPAELNAKEGAFLAMLLPSPKKYSVSQRRGSLTPYARRIIRTILNRMVQTRALTPEERDAQWARPFPFETRPDLTVPKDDETPDEETEEEPAVPSSPTAPEPEQNDSGGLEEDEDAEVVGAIFWATYFV